MLSLKCARKNAHIEFQIFEQTDFRTRGMGQSAIGTLLTFMRRRIRTDFCDDVHAIRRRAVSDIRLKCDAHPYVNASVRMFYLNHRT